MVAVRDAEVAARSIGLNPVIVKTAAFALSAVLTGLAGAMFAPLLMFVAPSNFPFSQSILFLLAVIVGGAGWTLGPVIGAVVSVVLPEMLSWLAEYRLLFFGSLLLVVLWLAPEGVIGSLAKLWRRVDPRTASAGGFDVRAFLKPKSPRDLVVRDVGIAFGGIRAASGVSFDARPGKVTSVIGPNGAGKTTVLNIVGGFYRADTGSVKLGDHDLSGASAWKVARAGISRTYQTTKLFTHAQRARQCADRAASRTSSARRCPTRKMRRIAEPPKRCLPSSAIPDRSRPSRATCRMSTADWSRSRARSPPAPMCCCSTSPPPA